MTTPSSLPRAVIFDLDGTLVTSSLDFVQLCKETGCVPGNDILRYAEALPEPKRTEVLRTIHQHEMDDAHSSTVMEGASKVLEHLESCTVFSAVVTRNSTLASRLKLERTGLSVSRVIAREHAPPKPSPDALLLLAREWNISPRECLYVGDFRYDLEAARNANMHAAWFSAGYQSIPAWAALADFRFERFDQFSDALTDYWESATAYARYFS